jgi:hypothetical protein
MVSASVEIENRHLCAFESQKYRVLVIIGDHGHADDNSSSNPVSRLRDEAHSHPTPHPMSDQGSLIDLLLSVEIDSGLDAGQA